MLKCVQIPSCHCVWKSPTPLAAQRQPARSCHRGSVADPTGEQGIGGGPKNPAKLCESRGGVGRRTVLWPVVRDRTGGQAVIAQRHDRGRSRAYGDGVVINGALRTIGAALLWMLERGLGAWTWSVDLERDGRANSPQLGRAPTRCCPNTRSAERTPRGCEFSR